VLKLAQVTGILDQLRECPAGRLEIEPECDGVGRARGHRRIPGKAKTSLVRQVSRFNEEQIIGVLRQHEAGAKIAASTPAA
jgi:hypothetical protein